MSSEIITINDLKQILGGLSPLSLPRVNVGLVGEVRMYAGDDEPVGWLKCDGRAISRDDYADLFTVIGTSYGSGDGSTTFNIPDLCGRFPVGKGSIKTNTTTYWGSVTSAEVDCSLGEKGGEARHGLTINEMPSHAHQIDNYISAGASATWTAENVNKKHGFDHWTSSVGGGAKHNNMPPYAVVNYIICAS